MRRSTETRLIDDLREIALDHPAEIECACAAETMRSFQLSTRFRPLSGSALPTEIASDIYHSRAMTASSIQPATTITMPGRTSTWTTSPLARCSLYSRLTRRPCSGCQR